MRKLRPLKKKEGLLDPKYAPKNPSLTIHINRLLTLTKIRSLPLMQIGLAL